MVLKKTVLPVFLATAWISISEFVRNEFILRSQWLDHYKTLGLVFPSDPLNGAIWGVWSLCYAISIFVVAKRFTLMQTWLLSWAFGFVLMWLVIGNLAVLPFGILPAAVPLSLLESFLASFIVKRLSA